MIGHMRLKVENKAAWVFINMVYNYLEAVIIACAMPSSSVSLVL